MERKKAFDAYLLRSGKVRLKQSELTPLGLGLGRGSPFAPKFGTARGGPNLSVTVSTNPDEVEDDKVLVPRRVDFDDPTELDTTHDDTIPMIVEISDQPSPPVEMDTDALNIASTSGTAAPPTLAEVVGGGVVVEGQGVMTEGDLVVPVGDPEGSAIVIPEDPNVEAIIPVEQITTKRLGGGVHELAIMKAALQRMAADPASWESDASFLYHLQAAREAANGLGSSSSGSGQSSSGPGSNPSIPSRPSTPEPVPDLPPVVGGAPVVAQEPVRPIPLSRISRPVVPVNRARPAAPMPAPAPSADGLIEYWRGGGKLGDSSVTPTEVEPIRAVGISDYAQDIITRSYNAILGRMDRTVIQVRSVQLRGIVSLPYRQGSAPMAQAEVTYERTYPRGQAPRMTELKWDPAVKNGYIDPAQVREYVPDNRIDGRRVSSVVRGEANMSNLFAQAVVPLLHEGHESYDLMGMFTILFILLDYSIWIDRCGLNRALGPIREASITTCNILEEGAAPVQAQIVSALEAIHNGRICLHRVGLTTADVSVLYAVGSGTQAITCEAGRRPFIHQRITSEVVNWMVWFSGAFALPAAEVVTTAQLMSTAVKLAELLDARADFVEGYIRAQTILNCKVFANPDGTWCLMMAGLDVERVYLPQPRGRHFIWNILTDRYVMLYPKEVMEKEFDILINRTSEELILIGALVSSIFSLAVSSSLNQVNIAGRELNAWAAHNPVLVRNFLEQLLGRHPVQGTVGLFSIACNVVTQFTGMKIAWTCFYTSRWSGGFTHRAQVTAEQLWQSEWGHHVPYLLRPEVLEWIVVKWLSVWGLSGPGLSYDISNEVYVAGPVAGQGLFVWRGDSKYLEAALSQVPFIYNPYGIFLLNAIKQEWRSNAEWIISYRTIRRSVGTSVLVDPDYVVEDAWQPSYDGATFTLVPGTLPTFDWTKNAILGPNVMTADIDGGMWEALGHHRRAEPSCAGYVGRSVVEQTPFNVQGLLFQNYFFGGGGSAAVAAAAAPPAPENVEN
uniref:Proline-alanine-rich protein n=1 Tax=dsRNA virus environmental sample TaxID=1075826 RepID=A0A0D4BTC2_9VIRU|nr:proline-alanine-rich protein [dsRNA virus environmental sample]